MARIIIVSDIHYAGAGERAHGRHYEFANAGASLAKGVAILYRDVIWMRDPLGNNSLLGRFISSVGYPDIVVANGDYTCDVSGLGVSHDEGLESVNECLALLRRRFGDALHAIIGDHELGKVSLLGDHGGLRLESWRRATNECGLRPFWKVETGNFVLLGVTSTLIGLPLFRDDALDSEWAAWEEARKRHLSQVREAFAGLRPVQRVLLFCHDPSALPYLWREAEVRQKAGQIAHTIVGHLHTRILLWKAKLLAGIPPVRCMGVSVQRLTTGLSEARRWGPFNVVLCPALAGIQLMRGGGFLSIETDETGAHPPGIAFHPLRRKEQAQSA